ncbi:hypothetical protein BH09MYX1_BH09MYX1_28850 [soil metagenome]
MIGARARWVLCGSLVSAAAVAGFEGCGTEDDTSTFPDAGSDVVITPDVTTPDDGPKLPDVNVGGPYNDFPPTAIVIAPEGGQAAPGNSETLFGSPDAGASSGSPCLVEPEIGSLYPRNWLRPRFRWLAPNGENLFELRVHAANQVNDLIVYTAQTSWTMPKAMWDGLRQNSPDVAMTLTVRGGVYASNALTNVALGSAGPLGIAPVDAPGAIVYWTTSGGSALKGFSIGDETVGPVLVPSQVKDQSASCIGCHTSTPDGLFVELTTSNGWNNSIGSVESGKQGAVPAFFGAAGKAALQQAPRGISTFSKAHWQTGDHVVVTTVADNAIGWVDLEAASGTASGILARTGDPRNGGAPTWSHDGTKITYVSTNAITTGRLDNGAADLYTIPYANRAGGAATPVPGASDPNFNEYYPIYSSDDALLAYDRIPLGQNMYNAPNAEVYVIPSVGGTSTRLVANDPPACTSKVSPGVTNSWPKWSPSATKTSDGRVFYWIVFSSTRNESGNPQLYVSPVVIDKGVVTTYHALYLWNQPAVENNHTPAWDDFKIPPPPPPN